jgi:hypothetical protein
LQNLAISTTCVKKGVKFGLDGEEGPAFLLPNGTAIFIGATHFTAIYTPGGGGSTPGSWMPGPPMILSTAGPGSPPVSPDAPGAMMMNGKVLLTLSYEPSGSPIPNNACSVQNNGANAKACPHLFYEYDYNSNTFNQIHAPGSGWSDCGTTDGSYMLDLPDGNVLYHPSCASEPALYDYQPDGTPLAAGQPKIGGTSANGDGTYLLSGVGLSGISEGAAFGDDAQMSTNYPLVRLTTEQGKVWYARTYNRNSTGVQAAAASATDFALPGAYLAAPIVSKSLPTAVHRCHFCSAIQWSTTIFSRPSTVPLRSPTARWTGFGTGAASM